MILVDSSVWIDFFRGRATRETDWLDAALGREPVLVGDLILTEVLQGFSSDRDHDAALHALGALELIEIAGGKVALDAAQHYRRLRAKRITVRKTIDTLIATRCIRDGLRLLYTDRDFDPFVRHCGLRSAVEG